MSSSPVLLSTSTSSSFPASTSSVISNSASQLACQTAIYVVVILGIVIRYPGLEPLRYHVALPLTSLPIVIVAIICGTILLIWNDNWTTPISRMESVRWPQSSGTSRSIVIFVLHRSDHPFINFIFLFIYVCVRSLRRVRHTAPSLVQWMFRYFFKTLIPAIQRLVRAPANPRQLPLPLFASPWFREPHLAIPRPAMLRDRSSFRVPFNSYSGSNPHRPPVSPTLPAFCASEGSAPLA